MARGVRAGDLTPTMLRLSTEIEFFRVALLQRLAAGFDFSSTILTDLLAICGDVSCFATHSSVTNLFPRRLPHACLCLIVFS